MAELPDPSLPPPDGPGRVRLDRGLRALARALLRTYFREIEVVGTEQFPETAPVIVVGNHFNSLIDGVLLTAFLPRTPRLIASSSVWDNRMLRPLLALGGVIPIVRQQDAGHGKGANTATFARAEAYLKRGGVLAIFPEGVSHSAPALQPVKSGAARIALATASGDASLGMSVAPVGLIFDEKNRFRSRALIEIGPPILVGASPEGGHPAAVRALTNQIGTALEALTPGYPSWDEAHAVALAATLWGRRAGGGSGSDPLAARAARMRAFRDGYGRLKNRNPHQAEKIRRDVESYLAAMTKAGLRDEDLEGGSSQTSPGLSGLLLRFPLAALGIVLNFLPFRLTVAIGRRQPLDKRATFSLFHAMWAFPVFWAILVILVAGFAAKLGWPPVWPAVGTLALTVGGGLASLGFLDDLRIYRNARRARIWLRRNTAEADALRQKRKALLTQLKALAAEDARSAFDP